jgi:hypothetical protein
MNARKIFNGYEDEHDTLYCPQARWWKTGIEG